MNQGGFCIRTDLHHFLKFLMFAGALGWYVHAQQLRVLDVLTVASVIFATAFRNDNFIFTPPYL